MPLYDRVEVISQLLHTAGTNQYRCHTRLFQHPAQCLLGNGAICRLCLILQLTEVV